MGSEVCAEDLTDAVNSFENPTLRSILAANLSGTVYEIDANQTSAKGEIQCDTGYVSSGVDCGKSLWYFYRRKLSTKICAFMYSSRMAFYNNSCHNIVFNFTKGQQQLQSSGI